MKIVLTGVNHKTASIGLREQLAISPAHLADATRSLLGMPGVREALILSTCNRVEILVCQEPEAAPIEEFLETYFHIDPAVVKPHLYEYREEEAVRHLFRVASSLDSMVIGEPQILGQVKESYLAARSAGAIRSHLDRLLQRTFTVAKRVRSETRIGGSAVSIASVAVELAQKIFGSLENKKVFLVGAGQMSELAARHLLDQGAGAVFVANRTYERAEHLARQFGGQAIRFEDLYTTAGEADIVITSTGAPHAIFGREHAQRFLHSRRGRPMFFIDIAVPRDVDPEVNRLDGIFLYDIDDLQSVASAHIAERGKEAEMGESMIDAEVENYRRRMHSLQVVPEIMRLQRVVGEIRGAEVRRVQSRLEAQGEALSPAQEAAVEALARSLSNKLLHHPLRAIKAAAQAGDTAAVEAIREALGFNLTGRYGIGEDTSHPAAGDEAQERPAVRETASGETLRAEFSGEELSGDVLPVSESPHPESAHSKLAEPSPAEPSPAEMDRRH